MERNPNRLLHGFPPSAGGPRFYLYGGDTIQTANSDSEAPQSAYLPAGYDEDDPYANVDLDLYPDWWRRNIEEFWTHDMRPYHPPRFESGEFTPPVIGRLEEELGVDIMFRTTAPAVDEAWELLVDGEVVETVDRHRDADGFTQYHLDSGEFERLVRELARGGLADGSEWLSRMPKADS